MSRLALAAALASLPGLAAASDLACTFGVLPGHGSLRWDADGGARLVVDDGARYAPFSCLVPVAAMRFLREPGFPRYVFEFDTMACEDAERRKRFGVSSRVTLVIYPAHGNRGTLFWSDARVMDECETVELGPAAIRAAGGSVP
jgi:hypothetical protein